jgi:hypothetical protein
VGMSSRSAAESTTARVLCGLCMQCPSCSCRVNAHNANMSRVLVGPIQIMIFILFLSLSWAMLSYGHPFPRLILTNT